MSVQREIIDRMTPELSDRYPGCGILVAGSVQRGEERPDSDLDLFVVFQGDGKLGMTHEVSPEGIKIDLALFPEAAFLLQADAEWFNFWMFSRAEIVHDPAGIAKRNQNIALAYFRMHPGVDAAWCNQIQEVWKHKADRSYIPEFPAWDDFSKHVRTLVAEPSPAAYSEGRADAPFGSADVEKRERVRQYIVTLCHI